MGFENRHKRHAYERSSISHVNNIHPEYANTAYNTHYKHIFKALDTFKSGDKRARGIVKSSCPCMCIQHFHESDADQECFCVTPD